MNSEAAAPLDELVGAIISYDIQLQEMGQPHNEELLKLVCSRAYLRPGLMWLMFCAFKQKRKASMISWLIWKISKKAKRFASEKLRELEWSRRASLELDPIRSMDDSEASAAQRIVGQRGRQQRRVAR